MAEPGDRIQAAEFREYVPLQFWHRHFGVHVSDSPDPMKALMSSYPHCAKPIMCRMGGTEPARFLVTADRAEAFCPIMPPDDLPDHVSIRPTSERRSRDWMIDILHSPPEGPFLAASVGQSGVDAEKWRISFDRDSVTFGGSTALLDDGVVTIYRPQFLDAMSWFAETGVKVSDILTFRDINRRFLARSLSAKDARAMIARIKAEKEILESAPALNGAVLRLASYGANGWERRDA